MLNIQLSTASGIKQILTTNTPLKIYELHEQIEGLAVCIRSIISYPNLKIICLTSKRNFNND